MHACEWRAILWLPPWVSPSPYCPAGGKEAKQVNVGSPLYHVPPQNCTTQCGFHYCTTSHHTIVPHTRRNAGGVNTSQWSIIVPHEWAYHPKYFVPHEWAQNILCVGICIGDEKYFSARDQKKKESATDPEIHKSRLHPISQGCTSMIANCHKREQRNRLNKISALYKRCTQR